MLETNIKWLKEVSDSETLDVGYKAHVLSELIKANISIPRGFVINNKNFFSFLQKKDLKQKIKEINDTINYDDKKDVEEKSKKIKELFLKTKFDDEFISNVLKMYTKIGESKVGFINSKVDEFVSIRASLSSEVYPLKELDFIEKQIGFLNIKGRENVLNSIKACWAELYSSDVLEYKYKKGFEDDKIHLSIIIQKMISGKKSGIMQTTKNSTKDESIIEAIHGFGGKSIISCLTPNHYEIKKKNGDILKKTIQNQEWMLKKMLGKTTKTNLEENLKDKQILNQREINELAEIGNKLEMIYRTPLEINWVIDSNDELYIISINPQDPNLKKIKKKKKINITSYQEKMDSFKKNLILEGIGVSSGIAVGKVKIVRSSKDLDLVDENTILVTKMTTLDMTPYLIKSKGVVTNSGGTICHAALISKKYDVPCVVHTQYATEQLSDGQAILVNGFNGKVYSVIGYKEPVKVKEIVPENQVLITENKDPQYPKTITKTIVKVETFDDFKKINVNDIDGVLITIDSLFDKYEINNFLEDKKLIVLKIKEKLKEIFKAFPEKEIYYKTNTHTKNLISENLSGYEIEAILESNLDLNLVLENIKSADEILPIKETTDLKIGVLTSSLNENIIEEYVSKGASFIIFSLDEVDVLKLKPIIKICKENKILRMSEISEKNSVKDVKSFVHENINGVVIDRKRIDIKDSIYRKERELLKDLLSV